MDVRPLTGLMFSAIFLLCAGVPARARSQDSMASVPAYPESEDGLKNFIKDMLESVSSGNTKKTSSFLASLPILDHGAWFSKTFGPEEGARLETRYQKFLLRLPDSTIQRLRYAQNGHRTDVRVTTLQKPADPNARLWRAITDAMIQPVVLYSANGTSAAEKYPAYLGDFVFVDGAFRSIDFEVFQALSTAPPMRIRQGGNVILTTLVHKVPPTYPDKAMAAHSQGSVVLHVVIGTDGTVKSAEPVSGDPVLAEAAVVAVKQWIYKPTLLNGDPCEVDSTVTVDFRL